MKLTTSVETGALGCTLSLGDSIMVLGSCFADEMGNKLFSSGFNVCCNPFGTLYNPESILNGIERLSCGTPFEEDDCVPMGAGADLVCSFSHHTSFARKSGSEFLENANASLKNAAAFWKSCNKVIVTFGTSMVWKFKESGKTVSNCLKRPSYEFTHEMLETARIREIIRAMTDGHPEKEFIFTVSPIRHLGDGAHANQISKARLITALDEEGSGHYFPAYEILLDELRDYRFYADDLVHPSKTAVEIIWERLVEAAVPLSERAALKENEKAARREAHRNIH